MLFAVTRAFPGAVLWLCGFAAVPASPIPSASRRLADCASTAGVWSPSTPRMSADTLAAARALESVGTAAERAVALKARGALLLALGPGSTLVPDRLALFLCDAADSGDALLSAQNPDGGWPMALGQRSNVLDTARVVEALAARDLLTADSARRAAAWLTARQQSDGLWTLSADGGPGRLALTARVVRALEALRASAPDDTTRAALDAALDAALPALRNSFRDDGRFSLDADLAKPASVTDTAEVYCALVRFDPPGLYSDALLLLEGLQAGDGHWSEPGNPDQDVYATAVALLALCAVRTPDPGPLADLLVTPSGIWFSPVQPQPGQAVVLHAMVFNSGAAAAANVQVAFYLGDPRTGGTRIGDVQTAPSVFVSGAAHVQVTLDTAALTASPRVFVVADPENTVPETDSANNLAFKQLDIRGLLPSPHPRGPNLHVSASGITFNHGHGPTLSLTTGPTVAVQLLLENTGVENLPSAPVEVRDGGTLIARLTAPIIPGGESVSVRFPWSPAPGAHTVRVTGDADDTVAETDETDNAIEVTLQVIGNACTVSAKRRIDGQDLDPPCCAYDVVRITVTSAYADAVMDLRILDPDGEPVSLPPLPLATPGVWQWNVGNAPPGEYTAQVRYLQPDGGALLARAETAFEVSPTTALRGLRVSLPKSVVDAGAIAPLPITVTLANGSNQDADWRLSWQLLDPDGASMGASAAPETIPAPAAQVSKQVVLSQPVAGTLTLAGRYTVEVTATDANGAVAAQGRAYFSLLPPLHLGVFNEVVPAQVAPLGKVRVRTVIRLTAGSGGAAPDVPVDIRRFEITPETGIDDDPTAAAHIIGAGVVNSMGQSVPDGTRIAVRTLYGSIPSGVGAPEADPEAGLRLLQVTGGAVQLDYVPSGTALRTMESLGGGGQWDPSDPNQSGGGSGEYSVVIVRFYQYFPGRTRWLGKNIANAEVFISKR